MARRDDFEGRMHQNLEILNREGIRGYSKPKNVDTLLVPVQIFNDGKNKIIIERDTRFDNYVKQWRGPHRLAPLKYILESGKNVILPNEYVIYSTNDGGPAVIIKAYGRSMKGK